MDKDILKKAADILVASGYADYKTDNSNYICWRDPEVDDTMEAVQLFADTLEGRKQLDTIFWYLIKGRDMFYLDGLGHLDHREQLIEFVKSELSK